MVEAVLYDIKIDWWANTQDNTFRETGWLNTIKSGFFPAPWNLYDPFQQPFFFPVLVLLVLLSSVIIIETSLLLSFFHSEWTLNVSTPSTPLSALSSLHIICVLGLQSDISRWTKSVIILDHLYWSNACVSGISLWKLSRKQELWLFVRSVVGSPPQDDN